jgi:hypothetical protein
VDRVAPGVQHVFCCCFLFHRAFFVSFWTLRIEQTMAKGAVIADWGNEFWDNGDLEGVLGASPENFESSFWTTVHYHLPESKGVAQEELVALTPIALSSPELDGGQSSGTEDTGPLDRDPSPPLHQQLQTPPKPDTPMEEEDKAQQSPRNYTASMLSRKKPGRPRRTRKLIGMDPKPRRRPASSPKPQRRRRAMQYDSELCIPYPQSRKLTMEEYEAMVEELKKERPLTDQDELAIKAQIRKFNNRRSAQQSRNKKKHMALKLETEHDKLVASLKQKDAKIAELTERLARCPERCPHCLKKMGLE